jgi:ribosomal protein RSM22 (predicted rRNA methylase)
MFNQPDCNHGGKLPVKVENGRIVSICDCLINNMQAERARQQFAEELKNV